MLCLILWRRYPIWCFITGCPRLVLEFIFLENRFLCSSLSLSCCFVSTEGCASSSAFIFSSFTLADCFCASLRRSVPCFSVPSRFSRTSWKSPASSRAFFSSRRAFHLCLPGKVIGLGPCYLKNVQSTSTQCFVKTIWKL